jgi:hypothetical protein
MLKSRIPVEPLTEDRLVQIERRIVAGAADRLAAPSRAPRRASAWAGMALAMAGALAIGWKLHRAPEVILPEPAPQTLALHTTAEHSTLELGDATLASDPGSSLDVTRTAQRVVIQMTRGRIEMAVVHRPERVLVVRAGETEIEDVGTKFSVAYDGASHLDVRVTEGQVKVTRQQRSLLVAAGYAWTTERGLVAIADLEAPIVASVTPAPAPPAPKPVAAPPVHHVVVHAEPPHESPPATSHVVPSDPYVDLKVAIRKQPIELDPRIDGQNDAAQQIAQLKPVAYSPQKYGDEASRALYKMAVLLYKPLHQDAEALRTIDMYLRRFHGTKELAAVLWLRVRITCGHTIDDECRHAAYTYQHEVPSGPAADVAIRIINAQ